MQHCYTKHLTSIPPLLCKQVASLARVPTSPPVLQEWVIKIVFRTSYRFEPTCTGTPLQHSVPAARLWLEAEQCPLWRCHCVCVCVFLLRRSTARMGQVEVLLFSCFVQIQFTEKSVQCQSIAGDFGVHQQLGWDNLVSRQFSHSAVGIS